MIKILNNWWLRKKPIKNKQLIKDQNEQHGYVVFTNYPYLFRKNLARNMSLQTLMDHRCIYIPNLKEHSADTVKSYKKLLSQDEKAAYIALLESLGIDFLDDRAMLHLYDILARIVLHEKGGANVVGSAEARKLLHHIRYKQWRKFFNTIARYIELICKRFAANRRLQLHKLALLLVNPTSAVANIDLRILKMPLNLLLSLKVNTTVGELKECMNFNFLHGTIKTQLQGRSSQMRRKIVSPKIIAIRLQIGLRFDLNADSIILPHNILEKIKIMLNLRNVRPFDLTLDTSQEDKLFTLPVNFSCIIKRDPVISKNSVVCIRKIGFADTDLMYISPYILHGQNADFDGDAEHVSLIFDTKSSIETKLLMLPNYNIYNSFLNLKLTFSETHVIFMHNNRVKVKEIFTQVSNIDPGYVDEIYNLEICRWFSGQDNIDCLSRFFKEYACFIDATEDQLISFVEPTLIILNQLARTIYLMCGNIACHDFFKLINAYVCEESKNNLDKFILNTSGLFCNLLYRIAISGAKGTLHHYMQLLKLQQDSGAGNEPYFTNNGEKLYNAVNENMRDIGKTVKQVPKLGHDSFKSLIEWNGIEFINDNIYYNDLFLAKLDDLGFSCQFFDKSLCLSLINSLVKKPLLLK